MLSILIPTYNYNIAPLVYELYKQCKLQSNLDFEIVVYDDGSELFHSENNEVNKLDHASHTILEENIGRSAIRNKLALDAQYPNLLFLDADVRIISSNFISEYLNHIHTFPNYEIVYGGIVYQENKPDKNQLLRWIYGNNREALTATERQLNPYVSFLTLNFLIKKIVFNEVIFNENIPNLRYEDLLFSYDLMRKQKNIFHLNNPVVHNGIETSSVFLEKTNDSLNGLKFLLEKGIINHDYAKISRVYRKLNQLKLLVFVKLFYKLFNRKMNQNLLGSTPSLYIYDIYRLGYFCNIHK